VRVEVEDTDTEIQACYEAGWTDGLPVIPPTRSRVDAMLGRLVSEAADVIAVLPPGGGEATLERVAANAVMAGCLPSYFPVVVAAVRAVADPEFNAEGLLTTVHSASPLLLVNGPISRAIGMNGEAGALGAGNRANATIGRALQLCCRNIAGARPGELDATTLAHPGKYSYCFTEHPHSPWPELAVDRGFRPEESAVTVYGADAPLCIVEMGRPDPESVLTTIAAAVAIPGTYNAYFRGELWLVLSPDHAEIISSHGWSKADIGRFMFEHAQLRAGFLRNRGLYGYHRNQPAWVDEAEPDEMIPIMDSPERLVVTVSGGGFGGYTAVIFGLGGFSVTKRVDT
jgi:hypothetical protein